MLAITATSNVCTAQVLLAVMASMYAVYHGPEGLRRIAQRVHTLTVLLATALSRLGYRIVHQSYFDTLCVEAKSWALLGVRASMHAVYHGPEGLRRSAHGVHPLPVLLAPALSRRGSRIVHRSSSDPLGVGVEWGGLRRLIDAARARRTNLRPVS